jgi:hypothetical protein
MHIIDDDSYTTFRLEPPPPPPSLRHFSDAGNSCYLEISVPIITEVHIDDIVHIFLETLYFGTES